MKEGKREFEPGRSIDLSNVALSFLTDHDIEQWFQEKRSKHEDRRRWMIANKSAYEAHRAELQSLVSSGDIPDDSIEAVWQHTANQFSEEARMKAIEVRNKLATRADDLKQQAAARLARWIPDWVAPETHVDFTIHETADFAISDHEIMVDVLRLSRADDPVTTAAGGISHELTHVWMAEGKDTALLNQRGYLTRKIVDEGLAVLIASDQLEEHHRAKGRDYKETRAEAHRRVVHSLMLGDDLKGPDLDDLFRDMGPGYIVGHDMLDAIRNARGHEGLRRVIREARSNPEEVFKVYQELQTEKPG